MLSVCVCVCAIAVVSQHLVLVELNGGERLVMAFMLSAFKTQDYYRPLFLITLPVHILASLLFGTCIFVHVWLLDALWFVLISGRSMLVQWAIFLASLLIIRRERGSSPALASASPAVSPQPFSFGTPQPASLRPGLSVSSSACLSQFPFLTFLMLGVASVSQMMPPLRSQTMGS